MSDANVKGQFEKISDTPLCQPGLRHVPPDNLVI